MAKKKVTIAKAPVLNLALDSDRARYTSELTWDESIGDTRMSIKATARVCQVYPNSLFHLMNELERIHSQSSGQDSTYKLAITLAQQGFDPAQQNGHTVENPKLDWRYFGIPSKAAWHILCYYAKHPSRPTALMNMNYIGSGGLATFNAL